MRQDRHSPRLDSADVIPTLREARSRRRNKYRFFVVGVAHGAFDLVAQAVIQGQPWLDLPVILNLEAHRVLRNSRR